MMNVISVELKIRIVSYENGSVSVVELVSESFFFFLRFAHFTKKDLVLIKNRNRSLTNNNTISIIKAFHHHTLPVTFDNKLNC